MLQKTMSSFGSIFQMLRIVSGLTHRRTATQSLHHPAVASTHRTRHPSGVLPMVEAESFVNRIVRMQQEFIRANNGKEPSLLYITNVDKEDIYEVAGSHLTPVEATRLMIEGPEAVLPTIFRMRVLYGAAETYLE